MAQPYSEWWTKLVDPSGGAPKPHPMLGIGGSTKQFGTPKPGSGPESPEPASPNSMT